MARKAISADQLDRLSVDDETGQLFWDGKEAVGAMRLPWWVQASAVLGAVSTLAIAIAFVITLYR